MKVTFVSNYINHHQIPFCNAMKEHLGEGFVFVQTQPMEQERVQMGWHEEIRPAFVKCFYEEEELCQQLIDESDVVLFGGTDDESYIQNRLRQGKVIVRISERLYKTGQWKAVSPRGLIKKYKDHTRYCNAQVYLLCAGGYVASDFHIVRAYPGKMFRWGYFPEMREHDADRLIADKGYGEEKIPYLLWAGRMIDWKHPELALETAYHLKKQGLKFHMDVVGGGLLLTQMEQLREAYGLQEQVFFLGFKSPEEVRNLMEKANIHLFTSDRQEGWGAVANEAMNSGCALVADHMIGAAPYLVENGANGFLYESGNKQMLFALTEWLVKQKDLREETGRKAYETIAGTWNAKVAAERLLTVLEGISDGPTAVLATGKGPMTPAPLISEGGMRRKVVREVAQILGK
ncbi:MAG: glycosyltransferase family 4 protein [Lachnospiraceae bacterium]|nr:glycosyltransferase family 4 protein [Lachnospiraceae bacterium]